MVERDVTIVEVGPRDGLQNEKTFVDTELKIELIDLLSACGLARIEVTSFVSPKWIPQLADAAEVLARITRLPDTVYSVLTPNMQGFEKAHAANVDEVAIFAAASETFSRKNINCSIVESLERFQPVAIAAKTACIPMRGYVSCVVECPYEGPVAPEDVARVTAQMFALGCHEVSLGDTVGQGQPETVAAMLDAVLAIASADKLAGHYHDTNGRAIESIEVSLEKGLRVFDSSIAGLGGCPYAPGAQGNVDTFKVFEALERLGYRTGLQSDHLLRASTFAARLRKQ
ncbi:MAG: hydroxymethylglutaryl-CoA lyase [Alphaproteobacteria bacterium]|nr:hydroxymethylglutaryl-CoA lyase [Alphaproteobacteria bacterium]